MSTHLSRRDALKALGLGLAGFALPSRVTGSAPTHPIPFDIVAEPDPFTPARAVTAVTLGAGNRGNVYGNFATRFPDQLRIVGVAEPVDLRRQRYASQHSVPADAVFTTWEQVFDRPKFADAIIITTPDDLHYAPCMRALAMGYDILLEKPIAPTEAECRDILALAERTGRIVAVCHVLRYAPYFQKMHAMLREGAIGPLLSMAHFEPIEHVHMAHSFVRGNWHDSKKTTPIILAKSCHDMDMIRWLVDQPCRRVTAFGDLSWFKSSNAPAGSTARCADGCAIEASCPYSALRVYHRNRHYTYVFDLPDDRTLHGDAILAYLKTTDYGRCVYRMDNDQPDHYVMTMQFDGGITVSFNMEAFTSYHGRQSRVMGAMGDIVGDMRTFTLTDFRSGEATVYDASDQGGGHGGGDWRMMRDWVKAVATQDATSLTSGIGASIESHLMAFAAERSRFNGTVEAV
jgi:predicted dehydrogenase